MFRIPWENPVLINTATVFTERNCSSCNCFVILHKDFDKAQMHVSLATSAVVIRRQNVRATAVPLLHTICQCLVLAKTVYFSTMWKNDLLFKKAFHCSWLRWQQIWFVDEKLSLMLIKGAQTAKDWLSLPLKTKNSHDNNTKAVEEDFDVPIQ